MAHMKDPDISNSTSMFDIVPAQDVSELLKNPCG